MQCRIHTPIERRSTGDAASEYLYCLLSRCNKRTGG
jgi:hypothetical protein